MPGLVIMLSVGILAVGVLPLIGYYVGQRLTEQSYEDADAIDDVADDDDLSIPAPVERGRRWGLLGEIWAGWRYIRKRKAAQGRGRVQWFLVDDYWPSPMFVKPKAMGGGIPEYSYKGEKYLFPRQAMLQSERQGLWTVVHVKGDADPVMVHEPNEVSIPTDMLDEYLTARITSSKPGFFDRFDIDTQDAIMYAIAFVIITAVLRGFL